MQITALKLRETLELVAPAVPRKSSLPACVHVRVGEGRVAATDLETWAEVQAPEADVPPFLLPHRTALDFLKAVPGDTLVTVEPEEGQVRVEAGGLRARFAASAAEDFPARPGLEAEEPVDAGELDGDALVEALAELVAYTATDDSRPVLGGVCLSAGDPAEACGADGFRLAYRELPFPLPAANGGGNLILPRGAVRVLTHLWRKAEKSPAARPDAGLIHLVTARRPLRLRYRPSPEGLAEVSFGRVTLLVRPIEGTFPSYRQLVPSPQASHVTAMAERLGLALRQVQEVARGGSGIVRLVWGDGILTLSARGDEVGEVEAQVPARIEGEAGRVAFNQGYLAEFLKGREGPVTLHVENPSAAALFTAPGTLKVVVMPMFVRWGDEPEGEGPQGGQDATHEGASDGEAREEVGGSAESPAEEAPASFPRRTAPEGQQPKASGKRGGRKGRRR